MTTRLAHPPDNPREQPATQKVRPSPADAVRQRGWPSEFQDAVLELTRDIPLGGRSNWILRRHGRAKERNQISHQVRLAGTGTRLMIGCNTGGSESIVEALRTILGQAKDDTPWQWVFHLDPCDERAARALRDLRALRRGSGLLPAEAGHDTPAGPSLETERSSGPRLTSTPPAASLPTVSDERPCDRHGLMWCAECAGPSWRAQASEVSSAPPNYDGPRPTPRDILISPKGVAHLSGCQHLPDYPWLTPPKWGWVSDPSLWTRIGNGHTLQATAGNLERVATRRCADCDL